MAKPWRRDARMAASLRGLTGILACTLSLTFNAWAADVYLSANGRDAESGDSPAHAVATLRRAVEIAATLPVSNGEVTRILVQPGTYVGQSVVINSQALKNGLTITSQADKPADFPAFVGDGTAQTWLTLKASNGQPTGLTIQALEIRDYFTAISLEGNRDDPRAHNSGTTIRRNVFRNIGSIALAEGDSLSTAAVRFVNSQANLVESNYFKSIRNKRGCGALHALYLAHFSSGNRIIKNVFDDACGSVVKLRDRSNDNVIEKNRFSHIEKAAAVEEWYCDMAARKDCTKKLGECPSSGNVQRGNVMADSGGSEMVSIQGELHPRAWCSAEDFGRERVLGR